MVGFIGPLILVRIMVLTTHHTDHTSVRFSTVNTAQVMMAPKHRGKRTQNEIQTSERAPWDRSGFPYQTDYNDHFETPRQAYVDVLPILDWLSQTKQNGKGSKTRQHCESDSSRYNMTIYDPYYCNGRTKLLLNALGYQHVIHEKRDFYADIQRNTIPEYTVLVTNPPYSDTHKRRCLEFCLQRLRSEHKPFLLLMPAYTATKQYYRELLSSHYAKEEDIVYLVPTTDYNYDHPEDTGKDASPFKSLWFFGVGRGRTKILRKYWSNMIRSAETDKGGPVPSLVSSLDELEQLKIINPYNRPNPRQRRRRKEKQAGGASGKMAPKRKHDGLSSTFATMGADAVSSLHLEGSCRGAEKSKYRDESGRRTKKRF